MIPVEPCEPHEGSEPVMFVIEGHQLPAVIDAAGIVQTEWELSQQELLQLMSGGRVRVWTYTSGGELQPFRIELGGAFDLRES